MHQSVRQKKIVYLVERMLQGVVMAILLLLVVSASPVVVAAVALPLISTSSSIESNSCFYTALHRLLDARRHTFRTYCSIVTLFYW
jgi:hypothetical protein